MKVLDSTPDGGKIILNPVRLPEIIGNSVRGFASGVLTDRDLVVSTIECTGHHETAFVAGIELDDIFGQDLDGFEIGNKHLRLQLAKDSVEVELWFYEYWTEAGNHHDKLPVNKEKLDELAAWTLTHPRIRGAYGVKAPDLIITLRDSSSPVWKWRDGDLARSDEGYRPAP
jgi:hypothetical protein